jgi:RNA polymerase sigma factor (sigma-70 family)
MIDSEEIDQLIKNAKAGNNVSRDKLFAKTLPRVQAWNQSWQRLLKRKRLSSRDLSQEVMLLAQRYFHHFHGNSASAWFAWIKKIHFRQAIRLLRNQPETGKWEINRTDTDWLFDDTEVFISKDASPGTAAMLNEQSDRVHQVLSLLEPEHQAALGLWMDGTTLEAHAQLFDLKIHQVRYIRLKALQEFHSLWKSQRIND